MSGPSPRSGPRTSSSTAQQADAHAVGEPARVGHLAQRVHVDRARDGAVGALLEGALDDVEGRAQLDARRLGHGQAVVVDGHGIVGPELRGPSARAAPTAARSSSAAPPSGKDANLLEGRPQARKRNRVSSELRADVEPEDHAVVRLDAQAEAVARAQVVAGSSPRVRRHAAPVHEGGQLHRGRGLPAVLRLQEQQLLAAEAEAVETRAGCGCRPASPGGRRARWLPSAGRSAETSAAQRQHALRRAERRGRRARRPRTDRSGRLAVAGRRSVRPTRASMAPECGLCGWSRPSSRPSTVTCRKSGCRVRPGAVASSKSSCVVGKSSSRSRGRRRPA